MHILKKHPKLCYFVLFVNFIFVKHLPALYNIDQDFCGSGSKKDDLDKNNKSLKNNDKTTETISTEKNTKNFNSDILSLFNSENSENERYLIEKAAKLGCPNGMNDLGLNIYYNGNHFKPGNDFEKAIFWFRKSAETGNLLGMYNLSVCLRKKLNVTKQNLKESMFWLKKSAKKGHIISIISLAEFYREGKYLYKKDEKKSLYWLIQAAYKNHANSIEKLNELYSKGKITDPILLKEVLDIIKINKNSTSKIHLQNLDGFFANCKDSFYNIKNKNDKKNEILKNKTNLIEKEESNLDEKSFKILKKKEKDIVKERKKMIKKNEKILIREEENDKSKKNKSIKNKKVKKFYSSAKKNSKTKLSSFNNKEIKKTFCKKNTDSNQQKNSQQIELNVFEYDKIKIEEIHDYKENFIKTSINELRNCFEDNNDKYYEKIKNIVFKNKKDMPIFKTDEKYYKISKNYTKSQEEIFVRFLQNFERENPLPNNEKINDVMAFKLCGSFAQYTCVPKSDIEFIVFLKDMKLDYFKWLSKFTNSMKEIFTLDKENLFPAIFDDQTLQLKQGSLFASLTPDIFISLHKIFLEKDPRFLIKQGKTVDEFSTNLNDEIKDLFRNSINNPFFTEDGYVSDKTGSNISNILRAIPDDCKIVFGSSSLISEFYNMKKILLNKIFEENKKNFEKTSDKKYLNFANHSWDTITRQNKKFFLKKHCFDKNSKNVDVKNNFYRLAQLAVHYKNFILQENLELQKDFFSKHLNRMNNFACFLRICKSYLDKKNDQNKFLFLDKKTYEDLIEKSHKNVLNWLTEFKYRSEQK